MENHTSEGVHDLSAYGVSEDFGFLLENPLTELPSYFCDWNDIAFNLVDYIEDGSIRGRIRWLSLLDHDKLVGHRELRLAHVMLAAMAAGYVWGNGAEEVPRVLPQSIAVPLWRVSERLGLPPVLCHASWVLGNWKIKDSSKPATDLYNREQIVTLPGGVSGEWFAAVAAQVDLVCAPGLKPLLNAQKAIKEDDTEGLTKNLKIIESTLKLMEKVLHTIHDQCTPDIFFNVNRTYIMGWGSAPFVKRGYGGLIYEGISDQPRQYMGDSAAQSPSIPAFDAGLGIEHGLGNEIFHDSTRQMMLAGHRNLILTLRKGPSIKRFVEMTSDLAVQEAYDSCMKAMANFRSYHLRIVVKFITIPLHKAERHQENYKSSCEGSDGADIIGYLKSTRLATQCHKST
ncbi:indoleamine 2,3-dioxygenase 1-like [Glandiceps talaboti]